jgi:hypothetical protein
VGGVKRHMDSAERETGKRATKDWKKTQRKEQKGGIYGRRESSEARLLTPCLIRRPLNPGVKHYD